MFNNAGLTATVIYTRKRDTSGEIKRKLHCYDLVRYLISLEILTARVRALRLREYASVTARQMRGEEKSDRTGLCLFVSL